MADGPGPPRPHGHQGFSGGRGRGRGGRGGRGEGGGELGNDYSQHFVDTGARPQNSLRDAHLTDLYSEYPKLKELIARKDALTSATATPPYYLQADLRNLPLSVETFGTKFDVILIDPPWEEYVRRAPGVAADGESWEWEEIRNLAVEAIADTPSFCFLWCGSAEGIEHGRACLTKWGFRRCEDIVWVKTNKNRGGRKYLEGGGADPNSLLQHTKEHCLMGIRGSVRRSADGHIIHANIDTDVVVSEEPPFGSTRKPEELYAIIEHFCMGRRRLELFGEDANIRPGWVTVGRSLPLSNFSRDAYVSHFLLPNGNPCVSYTPGMKPPPGAPTLVQSTQEIEALRPRSPSRGD